MTTDDLNKLGKLIDERLDAKLDEKLEPVKQGQKRLKTSLAQTNTAVARLTTAVETTHDTVSEMGEGLKEVVKDHRECIERLEEPEKHSISHKN